MPKKRVQQTDTTRDLLLFFGPKMTVRFLGKAKGKAKGKKKAVMQDEEGRWCRRCK